MFGVGVRVSLIRFEGVWFNINVYYEAAPKIRTDLTFYLLEVAFHEYFPLFFTEVL